MNRPPIRTFDAPARTHLAGALGGASAVRRRTVALAVAALAFGALTACCTATSRNPVPSPTSRVVGPAPPAPVAPQHMPEPAGRHGATHALSPVGGTLWLANERGQTLWFARFGLESYVGGEVMGYETSPALAHLLRRGRFRFPTRPAKPHADCTPAETAPASEPIWSGYRFDRSDPAVIADLLRRYHCRYPELTELVELGRSLQGRPVLALLIGRGVTLRHHQPAVLLDGSHHGNEVLSTAFVLDAVGTLLEGRDRAVSERVDRWLSEVVVVAVPVVNPDGRSLAAQRHWHAARKNGRDTDGDGERERAEGVDLNRNYPFRWGALGERASRSSHLHKWYRGAAPASEPETQAMIRLANSEVFFGAISFHTGSLAVLAPYTIAGVRSPVPNEAWQVAEEIVAELPPIHPQGQPVVRRYLYPVDGTSQDWLRATHGTLAYIVEGAVKEVPNVWRRRRLLECVRHSWMALIDRYLDGPSLYGRVVDAEGRPVQAVVSIAEIETREAERWASRCRDGRFDRYLPGPGHYTLIVEAPGMEPLRHVVRVPAGRVEANVVLPATRARADRCPTIDDRDTRRGLLSLRLTDP